MIVMLQHVHKKLAHELVIFHYENMFSVELMMRCSSS